MDKIQVKGFLVAIGKGDRLRVTRRDRPIAESGCTVRTNVSKIFLTNSEIELGECWIFLVESKFVESRFVCKPLGFLKRFIGFWQFSQ